VKILLSVPLFPHTGYGKDGLAIIDLFDRCGFDVYLDPDGIHPPIPISTAVLLAKEPADHYDVALKQFDPARLVSHPAERQRSDLLIGWTMWEWTDLDARLKQETISKIKEQTRWFEAIACYDQNTVDAMAQNIAPEVHVLQAQGGYDAKASLPVKRDFEARPFKFGMYGALTPRKGPWYAIEAFKQLRDRRPELDVELHLKTTEQGLHPAIEQVYPGVKVYSEIWPESKMRQFVSEIHCLVCPSTGEGKNMAALEFLSTGGPVIATNWGGHTVWMSDEFAYPLNCDVVLERPSTKALRADPSTEHLSELMEFIIDNPHLVRKKGMVAERLVPQMFRWEVTVLNLFDRLAAEGFEVARAVAAELRRGLERYERGR
jgi:glycosyltransferase involved in cell wall biosynthesis